MKKLIISLLTTALMGTFAFADYDNQKTAWGLGPAVDGNNRPADAVAAQEKYDDLHTLFIGDAEHKRLWLTFDEGYENGCTGKILDTLAKKGVKAAFFVTYDYAKDNPELIRRMIDEGHTVGNHTVSHPSLPECSESELYDELSGLHTYIKDNFNYDMYVMRPPKGEFSEKVLACAKDMGYTTVLWSFAYQDWQTDRQPDPSAAYDKITSKTHNGAVYLLHAVSETNAEILESVIDYWQENGYFIAPM